MTATMNHADIGGGVALTCSYRRGSARGLTWVSELRCDTVMTESCRLGSDWMGAKVLNRSS